MVPKNGGPLMLRHAALNPGRSLDENLEAFLDLKYVKWVTLLRPLDQGPPDRA